MKTPTRKERLKIPRQPMPQLDPEARRESFGEVNLGLGVELARREAMRCLECANARCVQGCPVGVQVGEFIALVNQGDFLAAARKVREDNALPAITGRVCPQEDLCEGRCILGRRFEPVAIGYLERFVADYEAWQGRTVVLERAPLSGKCVAVVGSGPAGLSAAADLAVKGHAVTVLEALHELGGVLTYGIPEFRLPKEIVQQEIARITQMGVHFETDVVVGKTVGLDKLLENEGFHAVFIATGAGLPRFLGIPGEDLNGIYSANEFLTRVNLMKAYLFPEYDLPVFDCRDKCAAVIGGGNTALDAIRTALRLGAAQAYLIYRRSEEEMPARREEIRHARKEGVEFLTLTQPVAFQGDKQGWLHSMRCLQMRLGEADSSGRPRPVPVPGSEFELAMDLVIEAVGTTANPLVQSSASHLDTTEQGYIRVDPDTLETSKRGVFAGGDIVTGTATVIQAMRAGRQAAASIHRYLQGEAAKETDQRSQNR